MSLPILLLCALGLVVLVQLLSRCLAGRWLEMEIAMLLGALGVSATIVVWVIGWIVRTMLL